MGKQDGGGKCDCVSQESRGERGRTKERQRQRLACVFRVRELPLLLALKTPEAGVTRLHDGGPRTGPPLRTSRYAFFLEFSDTNLHFTSNTSINFPLNPNLVAPLLFLPLSPPPLFSSFRRFFSFTASTFQSTMKSSSLSLAFLLLACSLGLSSQRVLFSGGREWKNEGSTGKNFSLSLPLVSLPLSRHPASSNPFSSSAVKKQQVRGSKILYKSSFRYTRALVLSLPVGTPPQTQQMVLDTGSQLSWIQCQKKTRSSCFDPSLSSTFSNLPCNTSLCKPPVPDFTIPTDCDPNRLCHYSYFYADGTLAEGNLVREKISLSASQTTPPIILGCARDTQPAEGILGMNLGRLSFASQAGISKFSYCVPPHRSLPNSNGAFFLGDNPNLRGQVRYVNLLRFDKQISKGPLPYLDKAAYSVGMVGVRLGATRLNIPPSVFRPDAGGAGQTMIDSGTEYTFLVEGAHVKIKAEVERAVGRRFRPKSGYIYAGGLDICYEAQPAEIGRLVGDVAMQFEGGAELVVENERAWVDAGVGTACLSVGSSQLLGVESNIIGNFHQQSYWVEFDLSNSRVGIVKADCSKAV